MTYSIYVITEKGQYIYDETIGSASYLSSFWVNCCDESFDLIPSMLGLADSEDGFVINAFLYHVIINDLDKLEARWRRRFNLDEAVLIALLSRSELLRNAVILAENLNLNVEIW